MGSEILVTFLFLDTTQDIGMWETQRHRYVGPVIWSKLSKDVKNAESIYSFKKKIRKVDLEQVITEGCKNCFLCCT